MTEHDCDLAKDLEDWGIDSAICKVCERIWTREELALALEIAKEIRPSLGKETRE